MSVDDANAIRRLQGGKAVEGKQLYRGVYLYSRYGDFRECEAMARIVDALDHTSNRFAVMQIFCDSKATHSWRITIGKTFAHASEKIAAVAACVLIGAFQGFNELIVEMEGEHLEHLSAYWVEDYRE
jgi:hypothetical protein